MYLKEYSRHIELIVLRVEMRKTVEYRNAGKNP